MDRHEQDLARRAALRLTAIDDKLPPLVEAAIESRAKPSRSAHFGLDPAIAISLGSLIVSAAGLAWQIYRDLRKDKAAAKPAKRVLERRVRLRFAELDTTGISDVQRGQVIEAVVEETLLLSEDGGGEG